MTYTMGERIAHGLVGALMFGIVGWFLGRPIGLAAFVIMDEATRNSLPLAVLYVCMYSPFVVSVLVGGVVSYLRTGTLDYAGDWVETVFAFITWPHRK